MERTTSTATERNSLCQFWNDCCQKVGVAMKLASLLEG
jgi:hypothetical protein